MSPTRRALILVIGVAVLAGAAFLLPLHAVPAAVARQGHFAPVAGTALGAALLVAMVPRTPISVACGLLFGAVVGGVCAMLATLIAASITFAAGRWLGRDFVVRRAGRRWHAIEGWVSREGILAVASVRAVPLGPYGLMGYAYGASNVRVRDYAIGTTIAGLPSAVTYAMLGAALGGTAPFSPLTLGPLAFGLVLVAIVAVRSRRHLVKGRAPS